MFIKPGQIWLEKDTPTYSGSLVYITKSKEPNEEWEFVCFQEWTMGGYLVKGDYTEKDIKERMMYIGHIDDILNIQYIVEQLSNIKFHSGKFSVRHWWLVPKRHLAKELKWINSIVESLLKTMNNKEQNEK